MINTPFPILGSKDVPLVGRTGVLDKIWSELTKTAPSNINLVGPRHIGKTVILQALNQRSRESDSPYNLTIYWDLGQAAPQTDLEFVNQLCEFLAVAMGSESRFKEHRDYLSDRSFDTLKEVMELLDSDRIPILMIWDGFDKPLRQGLLSAQLFGQLRSLSYGKCHKVVTAMRGTPTELARNQQVEDSPFWNMFDVNPIRVGPFDNADLAAALQFASLNSNPSGVKELMNWTGGNPVLVLSMLNRLLETGENECNNSTVSNVAEHVSGDLADFLARMWNSFSTNAKETFQLLAERGELNSDEVGKEERRLLISCGAAFRKNAMLMPSCRLLLNHIAGSQPTAGAVSRLFGTWTSYRNEMRSVLEHRVKHIPTVNNRLHRMVIKCIEDIPDYPDDCLGHLTGIEEVALDLIWQTECGTSQSIPSEIVSYWTQPKRDDDNIIKDMMNSNDWRIPKDRFKQLAILQRLTGSKIHFDSKSKVISKDTYVLLNAIHQFRNRTEHASGEAIHVGVAISALLLCVELLGCLSRELTKNTS